MLQGWSQVLSKWLHYIFLVFIYGWKKMSELKCNLDLGSSLPYMLILSCYSELNLFEENINNIVPVNWKDQKNLIFLRLSVIFLSDVTPTSFFRFLSPLSAVPLVSLVGFGLYELGFPGVSTYLNCLGSKLIYKKNSILMTGLCVVDMLAKQRHPHDL